MFEGEGSNNDGFYYTGSNIDIDQHARVSNLLNARSFYDTNVKTCNSVDRLEQLNAQAQRIYIETNGKYGWLT